MVGRCEFAPEDVVAIEKRSGLNRGIAIVHRRADYPRDVFFGSLRPDALIERIRAAGFRPMGRAEPVGPFSSPRGFADWMPLKWTVVIAAVAIWNALLLPWVMASMADKPPDPDHFLPAYVGLAPLLLFAFVLAIKYSASVQHAVLREGRSVGEILPLLNLLIFVAGMMSVIFAIILFASTIIL